jgi:hypothetical protein
LPSLFISLVFILLICLGVFAFITFSRAFLCAGFLAGFCHIRLGRMALFIGEAFIVIFTVFTQVMSSICIFMRLASLATSGVCQQIFRNNTFPFVILSNDNVYPAMPLIPFSFILIFDF